MNLDFAKYHNLCNAYNILTQICDIILSQIYDNILTKKCDINKSVTTIKFQMYEKILSQI